MSEGAGWRAGARELVFMELPAGAQNAGEHGLQKEGMR